MQRIQLELLIWPIALVLLFLMNPDPANTQSFCLFKRLGLPWCPGCGLGHSIHYLLHGQWKASFHSHPLGPFAVLVLLHRTLQLARQQFIQPKNPHI
jgi:hypothetical protein